MANSRFLVPRALAPPRRLGGRIRPAALTVALAAAVLSLSVSVSGTPSARADAPPPPSGWTLDFADNFNGPAGSRVSGSNWIYDIGTSYPGGAPNWGTGEVESMTDSTNNVFQDGAGRLQIRPTRDAAGRWSSGRIETARTDFQAPPGGVLRVEASIQQPNVTGAAAAGYWPAFWMLGDAARPVAAANWPGVGEVDILEDINGLSSEFATLHCGVAPGGPCNEFTGLGSGQHACGGCQTGFHTYRVEYDRSVSPEQLRWSVDGAVFFTLNSNQVDATTWNNALHHGFFVILNVAMGGGFPAAFGGGPTAATASGVPMLVDYVAVYHTGNGGSTPPPTGGRDAYTTLQAESFDQQSGVNVEPTTDTGGGQDLGSLANGDWVSYRGVDFGSTPARQFVGRVASGAAGGVSGLVEVRLDNRANPPVGSFAVANTGGWQSWRSVPANTSAVTGVHDVFLTFTSGQPADFVNVNWFTFGH